MRSGVRGEVLEVSGNPNAGAVAFLVAGNLAVLVDRGVVPATDLDRTRNRGGCVVVEGVDAVECVLQCLQVACLLRVIATRLPDVLGGVVDEADEVVQRLLAESECGELSGDVVLDEVRVVLDVSVEEEVRGVAGNLSGVASVVSGAVGLVDGHATTAEALGGFVVGGGLGGGGGGHFVFLLPGVLFPAL